MKRGKAGTLLLLLAGALSAVVACATALDPAPEPSFEPGRVLYAAKCGGCHRLRSPSKIDPRKWPSILDKMAVKAKLTPEQKLPIDAYVSSLAPDRGEKR
jgi:mono/diheme cytochrome c family protein